MRSRRRYNPADYNLVANPDLPRTNSPWRIFGALALAGAACFVAWHFLHGPVSVARPTLEFSGDRVAAVTIATNDTDHSVRLLLRFVLGHGFPGSDESPPRFEVVARHDEEFLVPARSANPVRCEFALPQDRGQLQAEVEILKRQ